MPAFIITQKVDQADRRVTAGQTTNWGVKMYKLILLAMAAMTFLATVPPGGKAGW